MKPGRELDALVAEKVMGWTDNGGGQWMHQDQIGKRAGTRAIERDGTWSPSTDIAAAWGVVTAMLSSSWIGVQLHQTFQGTSVAFWPHPCSHPEPTDVVVRVDPRDVGEDVQPEDPRLVAFGICLAALRAVGVEVDK